MEKADLSQHTSRRFNDELEQVFQASVAMGEAVERQLTRAIKALVNGDQSLAELVACDDTRINAMEGAIDQSCQRILATRGPTASDLRAVLAIHKSAGDFERVGDESKKIALIAAQLTNDSVGFGKYREIRHLAEVVKQMLSQSVQAYARLDAAAAVRVMRMDRAIDAEYEAIQRQCVTYMMEDRKLIQRSLDDMWTVRGLERIGDHAKNVCEYVVYVVHGEDIRHSKHLPPMAVQLAT